MSASVDRDPLVPDHALLAVAMRGDAVESVHCGSVAVVDADGRPMFEAGDPHAMVFTRSALKPLQALPFVRDGGPERFGYGDAQVAPAARSRRCSPRSAMPSAICNAARTHRSITRNAARYRRRAARRPTTRCRSPISRWGSPVWRSRRVTMRGSAARLCDAMVAQPAMVSGEGRSDVALARAGGGDWIPKIGAEGIQGLGIRSRGLGIACKVADGSRRGLIPAVVAVLDQLGRATSPRSRIRRRSNRSAWRSRRPGKWVNNLPALC